MPNLPRRVHALEAQAPPAVPLVMLRTFISPGEARRPLVLARTEAGALHRLDGESEAAFVLRIEAAARAGAPPGAYAVRASAFSTADLEAADVPA